MTCSIVNVLNAFACYFILLLALFILFHNNSVNAQTGVITTVVGPPEVDLETPTDLIIDNSGKFLIAVPGFFNRVITVDPVTGEVAVVAGTGAFGLSGDGGPATDAELDSPWSVCVDSSGNIFFSELNNHRIRKVDFATGIITTVAGSNGSGFSGDGGPAIGALLNQPQGISVDGAGNIFIADTRNDRIRKVDSLTGIITTVVGGENFLRRPADVFVDNTGNIFIADTDNHRILRADTDTGFVSTVAGTGNFGFSGDFGLATVAELNLPNGIFVDGFGNVFIADTRNHRIRKVDGNTGIITTVAGNGINGFAGDGSFAVNAQLNVPTRVFVDDSGNIFIVDKDNHRIRKVSFDSVPIPTSTVTPSPIPTETEVGEGVILITDLDPPLDTVLTLGQINSFNDGIHTFKLTVLYRFESATSGVIEVFVKGKNKSVKTGLTFFFAPFVNGGGNVVELSSQSGEETLSVEVLLSSEDINDPITSVIFDVNLIPVGSNEVVSADSAEYNTNFLRPEAAFPQQAIVATIDLGGPESSNGSFPSAVSVNETTNRIYVANLDSNNVSVIDGSTNFVIVAIPVGNRPQAIAVNETTNRVYVVNGDSDDMSVIDGATNQVIDTVRLPPLQSAEVRIGMNATTNRIYVAANSPGSSARVIVINGFTNRIIDGFNVPAVGKGEIAVNPINNRIYIVNVSADLFSSSISVIDGDINQVIDSVSDTGLAFSRHIAVNPETNRIYVSGNVIPPDTGSSIRFLPPAVAVIDGTTNQIINTILLSKGSGKLWVNPITNNIHVFNLSNIKVIDGATNQVINTILVDESLGGVGLSGGVGLNVIVNRIYVVNNRNNNVSTIDGSNGAVIKTVSVGDTPRHIGINPTTNRIYVANMSGDKVQVIDGVTNQIIGDIPIDRTPDGVAVNPITNRIYVGNRLDPVSVIDGAINQVIDTISFSPGGESPRGISVNPVTNSVYVVARSGLFVIDGVTHQIINTNQQSFGNIYDVAINSTTDRIYLGDEFGAELFVIDGATNQFIDSFFVLSKDGFPRGRTRGIAVNATTNRIYVAVDNDDSVGVVDGSTNQSIDSVRVFDNPKDVGVNEITNHVYVTTDNEIVVIDGATNTIIASGKTGEIPDFVGVNPVTGLIYVANRGSGDITVIQDDRRLFPSPTPTPTPTPVPTLGPCFSEGTITILDIDPPEGTILPADETQTFTATVQYSLFNASAGSIFLVALDSNSLQLLDNELQERIDVSSQTGTETVSVTADLTLFGKPVESVKVRAIMLLDGNLCSGVFNDVEYKVGIELPIPTPTPSQPLKADFTAVPTSGTAPLSVQFIDLSIGDDITNWTWRFGDETESFEKNPKHIYTTPGLFTVELLVLSPFPDASEKFDDIITKTDFIKVEGPVQTPIGTQTPTQLPTVTPESTPTPIATLPPTLTPTSSPTPNATQQPKPTLTPSPIPITPTPIPITPTPIPIPTPDIRGKSFTFNCEHSMKRGPIFGLEKLTINVGDTENCTLKLTNHEPGKTVEISTLLRKGLRSAIKVESARSVTDANGKLEITITAIRKGTDWAAWAVKNAKGRFEFNKRSYDAGFAWGMFVEVQ